MRKEVSSSKITFLYLEYLLPFGTSLISLLSSFHIDVVLPFKELSTFFFPPRIPTRIATCYNSLSFSLFSSPSPIFQVVPRNFLFVSRELKPQSCSWGQTNRITGILFGKILPTIRGEKFYNFFPLFYFFITIIIIFFILIFFFSLNEKTDNLILANKSLTLIGTWGKLEGSRNY